MPKKLALPDIPLPPSRSNLSRRLCNNDPAAFVKPAPRRTHEEVLAEKARKEAEKQARLQKRNASLQKAAEIEVAMDFEDTYNLDHPISSTLEKNRRPKVEQLAKPPNEDGSSDEYDPDAIVNEEGLDDSGDDVDEATTTKSRQGKVKGIQRAALMVEKNKVAVAARSSIFAVQAPTKPMKTNLKRAPPPLPLPSSKKVKQGDKKPALRTTWFEDSTVLDVDDNDDYDQPTGTDHHRSPSVGSCSSGLLSGYHSGAPTSEDGITTRAPSEFGDVMEKVGMVNEGGLSSDEDSGQMERMGLDDIPAIQSTSNSTLKSKVKTLAKVNVTVSASALPARRARIASGFESKFGIKRDKITVKHLDNTFQELFAKIYTPYIRQFVGVGLASPWDNPSETDLITTWNSFSHKAGNPDLTDFQREVVLKLTIDRLVEWRNSFATAAITTLDAILSAVPTDWEPQLSTTERRSAYAQWLGEGENHERNFYYREISVDESNEDQMLKKLMSVTLATHLTAISPLRDSPYMSELPPKGALVLCVQACKQALAIFDTGVKVVPTGIAGHFSRANWMDQDRYVDGGRVVKDRRTSSVQGIVGDINKNQWKAILKAAGAVMKQKPSAGIAEPTTQFQSPPRKKVVDHDTYSDSSESE